jgi:phosphatidylserine/phosphatidylglycerophosphate/cardiolipin synthase-like enzyme
VAESSVAYQITVDGTTLAVEGIRGYFQSKRAGLDAHLATRLATFLDDAHDTIDCAIYDLRHPLILDALAHAVARKVRVRIAYDAGKERVSGLSADPKPDGTEVALSSAGLLPYATPVHEHGRHLMHDKFVLRDGRDMWVGSANFTTGGLELQDNTCLTISSRELVARFAETFAQLTQPQHRHTRSAASLATVEGSSVVVGSTSILPLFEPESGESIEQELVNAIHGARKIRLMAFLLSDPGILQALASFARQPAFDIRGVYDPHGMEDVLRYTHQDHALFWFMHDSRFVAAPSHAFSPEREQDFMHNKTLVLDDQVVFTGSYNFSENAEANDETLLKIASEPIAAAYSHYCDVLFAAYGGAIASPQRGKAPSDAPRRRIITAPPLPSVTPGLIPAVRPVVQSAAQRAAHSRPSHAETPSDSSTHSTHSTRTLDVLVFVVSALIVAVLVALMVYLLMSGIVRV